VVDQLKSKAEDQFLLKQGNLRQLLRDLVVFRRYDALGDGPYLSSLYHKPATLPKAGKPPPR
jgi:hypothetical protein